MKPLNPCRCKSPLLVLIHACDWEASWGPLPPGAVGAIYCGGCGAWRKWPSREDARGSDGFTADKLPRSVIAALTSRGAAYADQARLL